MYVWLSVCVYMCTMRVQESIEIRRGFRYLGTRDGSHHAGARCLVGTPSLLLQLLHSLRSPIPLSPNPSHSENFQTKGRHQNAQFGILGGCSSCSSEAVPAAQVTV